MNTWKTLVLLVALVPARTMAETFVHIENRTGQDLQVSSTSDERLSREYWAPMARVVPAGKTVKVLRFNRNSGITDGSYFHFHTKVQLAGAVRDEGGTVDLVQKLRGTPAHSHLWQAVHGDPFSDERNVRHHTWQVGGSAFPIEYQAVACGISDDDVVYRFLPSPQVPEAVWPLKVLSYNVWMRPVTYDGQSERARLIAPHVSGHDVIAFSELFDDEARDTLLKRLKPSYPFQTNVIGEDNNLIDQDGGVVIVSRYPIVRTAAIRYQRATGWDQRAAKGALYAEIAFGEERVHVFATHLQADDGTNWIAVRTSQLEQLREFIDACRIPCDQLVLLAGDLNIAGGSQEYSKAEQLLGLTPVLSHSGPDSNDRANPLATAPFGHLDHVVPLRDYRPARVTTRTLPLIEPKGWSKGLPLFTSTEYHLSDHHALAATIEPLPPLEPAAEIRTAQADDSATAEMSGPAMSLLGVGTGPGGR